MLNIIIQVILALVLIIIMAIIAYSIYDREYLKSINFFNTNRKETSIFKGIYPFNEETIQLETLNRADPYYYDLNPSVNQNGGAEYSYNFWLYVNINNFADPKIATDESEDKYIVLFYKGAKQLIPYKQFNYSCDTLNKDLTPKPYVLVKNPLVKIRNDGKEVVIEYNNINTPDTFNSSSSPITCSVIDSIYDNSVNKLGVKNIDTKMFNKTFNMITIVIQENPNNEDVLFQNRTNCKVYFNGGLISDRSTYNNDIINDLNTSTRSTVMRNNMGNFYLNPYEVFQDSNKNYSITDYRKSTLKSVTETDKITKDVPLKMANLSYYNYALTVDDIYKLYNKGYSPDKADILLINDDSKKNITKGKKINFDIYNTDNPELPIESI
jgi:hypothetical protein